MIDLFVAALFGFATCGIPSLWVMKLMVDESQRKDAQIDRLLDRIQEPDIERRVAVTVPVDDSPLPDWMYDDTGLVRVEDEHESAE